VTAPMLLLVIAATGLAAMAIVSAAALKGWNGWLELRRFEVPSSRAAPSPPTAAARIELADLRERVRKLEAIALGIDL
jgi:hypothetical protein